MLATDLAELRAARHASEARPSHARRARSYLRCASVAQRGPQHGRHALNDSSARPCGRANRHAREARPSTSSITSTVRHIRGGTPRRRSTSTVRHLERHLDGATLRSGPREGSPVAKLPNLKCGASTRSTTRVARVYRYARVNARANVWSPRVYARPQRCAYPSDGGGGLHRLVGPHRAGIATGRVREVAEEQRSVVPTEVVQVAKQEPDGAQLGACCLPLPGGERDPIPVEAGPLSSSPRGGTA